MAALIMFVKNKSLHASWAIATKAKLIYLAATLIVSSSNVL